MPESKISTSTYQKAANDIVSQLKIISSLFVKFSHIADLETKERILDEQTSLIFFFLQKPNLYRWIQKKELTERVALKSFVFIEQYENVFGQKDLSDHEHEALEQILLEICEVEKFYDQIGGVLGYHKECLELILEQQTGKVLQKDLFYIAPKGLDLTQDSQLVKESIIEGIKSQKLLSELYPVGGAADRLNLQDEKMHFDLPAARLEFLGRTLLEGIVRDVFAREYLYYKIFGEHITIPIALMTSQEKNNHRLVLDIISENQFFLRPKDSFKVFSQPLVPTFTEDGKWCLKEPMKLLLKPGGHGAIWKLACENGVFGWMEQKGKEVMLIRQINNPVAGVDFGLLALVGYGVKEKKKFGFASCPRRVKTSEGMNIIKYSKQNNIGTAALSNIEYCDFEKYGVEDAAKSVNEPYSIFPSNTNILFSHLPSMQEAIGKIPFPGKLVNFKPLDVYHPQEGSVKAKVARLELLMQNVADAFEIEAHQQIKEEELPSFLTFNQRHKTISPTKKQFIPGSGLVETAVGCFYDYLKNAKELLEDFCFFKLPLFPQEENFLSLGPSFIFLYHPSLGPLYSVICQKIKKGRLYQGAELQLEIADVYMENISIEGSLLIHAKNMMGVQKEGVLYFSNQTGRAILKNVKIKNKGITQASQNVFWKNKLDREESCFIYLEGYSEFVAENVVLDGDYYIVVKDGERVVAYKDGDEVLFRKELMPKEVRAFFNYKIAEDKEVIIELNQEP